MNSSLRVLRRVLKLAFEWGASPTAPKLKLLPGERHRERVISTTEEARYLAVAPDLLLSIVTVLIDTGMRPDECFRLPWESVTWTNGRHGTVLVTHEKTKAARRILPMTPRVRALLEARWMKADKPDEGGYFLLRRRAAMLRNRRSRSNTERCSRPSRTRPRRTTESPFDRLCSTASVTRS